MAKKPEEKDDLTAIAKKIAAEHKVSIVYANSKNEFFTNKNYALGSENGKAAQVKIFDFSAEEVGESDETKTDDE